MPRGKMMEETTASQTLADLDELATAEYGTTFAGALEGQPEEMFARRLARLSGIPMKQPFANPKTGPAQSITHALRYWELKPEIDHELRNIAGPFPILEGMRERKDPALEIVAEMAKIRWNADPPTAQQMADTILNAHAESNWFTNLILVIRPRLCGPGNENKLAIEAIKKAADDLAHQSVEFAIKEIIGPVAGLIIKTAPFLHFVPTIAVVGATYFIVKFAGKSFCTTEIFPQIQMLLDPYYEIDEPPTSATATED